MQLTLLKGYPDFIGKRAAWAGYGNGPSSYVTGGDPIIFPAYNYYLDSVDGDTLSVSGNYETIAMPSGVGARQSWKLLWYPAYLTVPGTPLGFGVASAASTLSAAVASTGVITVTVANSLVAGQFVLLYGFTQMAYLNGTIVQVATASSTQFTAILGSAGTLASAGDTTGHFKVVQAAPANLLQASSTVTAIVTQVANSSQVLTITGATGAFAAFSPGQFVFLSGLSGANNKGANGIIVQLFTVGTTTMTANCPSVVSASGTAGDTGTVALLVTNGGAPVQAGFSATISNTTGVASTGSTQGVFTALAYQNFAVNNIVVLSALSALTTESGQIVAVNSASIGPTTFNGNCQVGTAHAAQTDTGTATLLVTGQAAGRGEVPPGTNLSAELVQIGGFGGQY